jgi:hypothetical protein
MLAFVPIQYRPPAEKWKNCYHLRFIIPGQYTMCCMKCYGGWVRACSVVFEKRNIYVSINQSMGAFAPPPPPPPGVYQAFVILAFEVKIMQQNPHPWGLTLTKMPQIYVF